MAAVRFIPTRDAVARAAATPILRLVQDASLRAWQRPGQAACSRAWRGIAASVVLHVALIAVFVWQATGGEPASRAAVEVVFRQASEPPAKADSGDVPMKIEEAPAAAEAELAEAVPPAEAPVVVPSAEAAPSSPVEIAAIAPAEPALLSPVPAAEFTTEPPPEAQVMPLPPARPARKKPIEAKPPAPTMAATDSVRTESPPAPVSEQRRTDAFAAAVKSLAAADPRPSAEPAPPSRAEIPVVHEARFREPPTPARYPPRAVDLNQQGTVIIRALVAPDGTSGDILVWRSSGYALLDAAALRAVRGWSFEPSSVGGRAITAWVEVPVRFAIR